MAIVKQEDIYFKDYLHGADVNEGPTEWFERYAHRHPQQRLGARIPFKNYRDLSPT